MTQTRQATAVPGFAQGDDYRRLRDFLEAHAFTQNGVLEAMQISRLHELRADDLPILKRRTSALRPLDCMIRLFLMETRLDPAVFAAAIQPFDPATWAAAGLIRTADGQVEAAVKLLPFQGLWVAFDRPQVIAGELGPHFVMGIGASSLTLANLSIRRPLGSVLDLGTGCGIQALLAARHSDRVAAVDCNPRALGYTEFNARLNALPQIETRLGNLFEPLMDDRFDLIVSNPPFVISPENHYTYRDSGLAGDAVCRAIARQAPAHLNPGGTLQMLCNWVEPAGNDWRDGISQWFSGSGCNVWVLRSESRDAATYAATWIRHTERDDPDQFARRFDQWLHHYERHGITAIGAGLITMRRSARRPNWLVTEDLRGSMRNPCGNQIAQAFARQDFLMDREDDAALLKESYRIAPAIRLTRELEPAADGWREIRALVELREGLPYQGTIDPLMANILVSCDGNRPLAAVFAGEAARLGLNPAGLQSAFTNVVRHLIRQGFLIPSALFTEE